MTSPIVSGAPLPPEGVRLIKAFERRTGLAGVPVEVRERAEGPFLLIHVANPTERFFTALEDARRETSADGLFPIRATLKKGSAKNLLKGAESKLFLKVLAESLTVNRHSFEQDFFSRYIRSVSGAEDQIVSAANHVVLGRRGSGKSSLLLYAMHSREVEKRPFAWIDMQVYAQRSDLRVVSDVIGDIVAQATPAVQNQVSAASLLERLEGLTGGSAEPTEESLRAMLPELKRLFGGLVPPSTDFAVFLDDFHVIDQALQPRLLHFIYAFSRGNRVNLKISAIETFTKLWDPGSRVGLEPPHDAQLIKLDYNLTMADKASAHIRSILDAHAAYCGLPSVRALCRENDVLSRLVWVAAGVPRDALNVFAQAITRAAIKNQSRVTVTNINVAASDLVTDKLRYIELDSSGQLTEANDVLARIREFCIKQNRNNAFLVEVENDNPVFERVRQLIDLRLLHVINEGIVKREAGRKHIALILDYGFYIGVRAAKSVDLFNKDTGNPTYNELRGLPVFAG